MAITPERKAELAANRIVELGVDEGLVNGRLALRGYWTLVDGRPRYVEVEGPANLVVSEYNPLERVR